MKLRRSILVPSSTLAALGLVVACASTPPPKELLDARAAYSRAQEGPAARLDPASLHEAKLSLQRAENAYADDPDSPATRDYAYIAGRKAELAEARAGTIQAEQRAETARAEAAARTKAELSQARERIESEKKARQLAEQRMRDALNNLATVASNVAVKNDTRGTVITIPGSVLFASGKTELLAGAKAELDKVAQALRDSTGRRIEINGYTDSVGSEEKNQKISQDRADHVRDYLVSQGVPEANVTARGFGPAEPIADNKTSAGKAMNRRVEIIVEPASGSAPASPSEKWKKGQNPAQEAEPPPGPASR
jgi:outer membrane protein OmpA-like peptidoglycan-associated protein